MEKNPILLDLDGLAKEMKDMDEVKSMSHIANYVKLVITGIVQEINIPGVDSQIQISTRSDDNIESVRVHFRMSHNK